MLRTATTALFTCLCFAMLISCGDGSTPPVTQSDSVRFHQYLSKGDSIYATKSGLKAIEASMRYFDSAGQLAQKLNDSLLLAEATFAKGRIYDAWNQEPQKTIQYFTEAANLFKDIPGKYVRYMYVRHLVAHAYDKVKDSANCVRVLAGMYNEILTLDKATRKRMPYTTEMALISTEVRNYALAEAILNNLVDKHTIVNDSNTYDYRDHYFITQSRLDVYYRKSGMYPYVDSLTGVYRIAKNAFDSSYYSEQLYELYTALHRYDSASKYLALNKDITVTINSRDAMATMQNRLLKTELAGVEKERELEARNERTRTIALWMMIVLLVVITYILVRLSRRNKLYKVQQQKLLAANTALDEKNCEVLLLNKEIQHRIKNNMSMIISLLKMQERKTDNPEVIEHLQNAKLRIESISALYAQFMDGNNHDIEFAKYIPELINNIVSCIDTDKNTVTHLNVKPVKLSNSQCHALSLILNEWVTNSVKYAACENNVLQLYINIENETADSIVVEYKDNGKARLNGHTREGLGTQIIQLLIQQLKGRFTHDETNRYSYKLTIPNGF